MLTKGYSCSGADESNGLKSYRNISLISLLFPCTNLLHKTRYYLSLLLFLISAFLPYLTAALWDGFCPKWDLFCFSPYCIISFLEEELWESHLPWLSRITDLRSGSVSFGPPYLITAEEEQLCVDLPGSFPNDVLWQWPQVPCLINYVQWEEKVFQFVLNLNFSSNYISCYIVRCSE